MTISPSCSRLRLLLDFAVFALLLLLAWVQAWTPGQLAWALWISGFVMLMAWLAIMAVYLVKEDGLRPFRLVGTLLGVVLLGWGIAWVYRFYGEMLDLGFPLLPDPGRVHVGGTTWRNVRAFELWPTVLAGVREFHVVLLLGLLPLIDAVRSTWPDSARFRMAPGLGGGWVRLHFTVMALIALQIFFQGRSAASLFLFSAAILTINNFPWYVFARRQAKVPAP